jgi:hypothetical protein
MEPIVQATWGLVVATAILGGVTLLQYLTVRRQASDERKAATERQRHEEARLAALSDQAAALKATAAAQQAVVAEMIEDRKAGNPLRVELVRRPADPGYFDGTVTGVHGAATVLRRVTFHIGQGVNVPDEPVVPPLVFGNAYLTGASGQLIRVQFLAPPFDKASGDLLVVRVTGRPANGIEQTLEFLYRITPERTLEDLATAPEVQVFFGR